MLKAINDLNAVLKPEDNLLIYYAGHGARLQNAKNESGYWLPVNAEPPPKDTFWVPNEQITGHLGRLPAKRVLVVADSCYAGSAVHRSEPAVPRRQGHVLEGLPQVQTASPRALVAVLGRR